MKRKPIIILVVLVTISAGIFITNRALGNKVAESVDEQLQSIIKEKGAELPFDLQYSHITASPMTGSVTIHNYAIIVEEEEEEMGGGMTGSSVKLSMPITEVLALGKGKELMAINKMTITMEDPETRSESGLVVFEADYFRLSYDGELSLFELERAEKGFLPESRQQVAISAKGMRVASENFGELLEELDFQLPANDALSEQFKEKADFELSVEFDPDKKVLVVDEFSSKNGFSKVKGSGALYFEGNSVEEFESKRGNFSVSYQMESYETEYSEMGKIVFDGGSMEVSGDFDYSRQNAMLPPGIPDMNISLETSLDGFEIELGDEFNQLIAQTGISLNQNSLKINEIQIDFKKENDEINLKELLIDIEDMVRLKATIKMAKGTTTNIFGMEDEDMLFSSSKIEISDLSDSLEEMIEEMEASMPNPFPRKGSKIVIELTGALSNPQIKGVTD
ncbi:MAG: hypothetical protein HEP71_04545 [Roseivirga sp.]|nr:hypothetical protein [Roseivirga sp.]